MDPRKISIEDYTYSLPDEKIALHPLTQRDASKLLLYKNGDIEEQRFSAISTHLPENSLLVFNDTKVINARISFFKSTGARIEIFCLEPNEIVKEYATVMSRTGAVEWKCFVGGLAKWKENFLEKNITIGNETVVLTATRIGRDGDAHLIRFSWEPASHSFAAILQSAGAVPLPPYIKRLADTADTSRYQTIFAEYEGSVAAPTAGLHFTKEIFDELVDKNISRAFVTLHVGAGTFKPVQASTMEGHDMHSEYIDVDIDTIKKLQLNEQLAAVGTTSLRTIETLYWLGAKAWIEPGIKSLDLKQWDVYETALATVNISAQEALQALVQWMEVNKLTALFTKTQLLIVPGYKFRMAKMLITNFHQPQSTLLLLVAAAIGEDWKKMYAYALENNFRFLSYGDANLIFINNTDQN